MTTSYQHLKGGPELMAELGKLPAKLEANVIRGGVRAGVRVLEAEVERNLQSGGSVDSGELLASVRSSARKQGGQIVGSVKAGNAKAWYWRFVEFGTAAHWIRAKKGSSLFLAGLLRQAINHPGARAKPFVRPALDAKGGEAVGAVLRYISKRLGSKRLTKEWGTSAQEVGVDGS